MTLPFEIWLVAFHVVANVVWIGSILSVAVLVSGAPASPDAAELGRQARRIYRLLAAPAFGVSFLLGVWRFVLSAPVYAHMPWIHAKLSFALVAVVLHHVIGGRTKKLAAGHVEAAHGVAVFGGVLFAAASAAAVLGVLKMFP
jgi:uncharacterized membrane protein